MSEEQSKPSGPDLTLGVAIDSLADGAMLGGHVGDDAVLLARRGDEFTVISTDGEQPAAAETLANQLLDAIAEEFNIHGHQLRVSVSIGAVERAPRSRDGKDLLESADRLLYEAKRGGRNRCVMADAAGTAIRVLQGEEPP